MHSQTWAAVLQGHNTHKTETETTTEHVHYTQRNALGMAALRLTVIYLPLHQAVPWQANAINRRALLSARGGAAPARRALQFRGKGGVGWGRREPAHVGRDDEKSAGMAAAAQQREQPGG